MFISLPRRGIAGFFGLVLVAASCGNSTNEVSDSTQDTQTQAVVSDESSSETETTETSAAAQSGSSSNKVELLDAGESPRVELRLQLDEGVEVGSITQEQTITQSGIAGLPPGPLSLAYTMDIGITVTKSGDNFVTASEVLDIAALDETDQATAQVIPTLKEQFVGLETSVTLNPVGQIVEDPEVSGDENLDPEVAQVVDQINSAGLAAPLPTEAVGQGATWKLTQEIELSGIEVTQETTFEVISIDGNVVTINSVTTQTVEEGSVMEAQGQELPVKLWESNAVGKMQLDLTKVFPSSTADTTAKQIFETPDGDLSQEIDLSVTTAPS